MFFISLSSSIPSLSAFLHSPYGMQRLTGQSMNPNSKPLNIPFAAPLREKALKNERVFHHLLTSNANGNLGKPNNEILYDDIFAHLMDFANLDADQKQNYANLSELLRLRDSGLIKRFLEMDVNEDYYIYYWSRLPITIKFLLHDPSLFETEYIQTVWPYFYKICQRTQHFARISTASEYFDNFISEKWHMLLVDLKNSYPGSLTPSFLAFVTYKLFLVEDINLSLNKLEPVYILSTSNSFGLVQSSHTEAMVERHLTIDDILYILTVDSIDASKRVISVINLIEGKFGEIFEKRDSIHKNDILYQNLSAMSKSAYGGEGRIKLFDYFVSNMSVDSDLNKDWFRFIIVKNSRSRPRDKFLVEKALLSTNAKEKLQKIYELSFTLSVEESKEVILKMINDQLTGEEWKLFSIFYLEQMRELEKMSGYTF
eukprot:NODE_265_length_12372_cov_0.450012.p4 type:complete len:428 gc:universal NODE_265_length_12372_cov_0.450012:4988-3705(-)